MLSNYIEERRLLELIVIPHILVSAVVGQIVNTMGYVLCIMI